MSTPAPFIDASLGRGLARQSTRDVDARMDLLIRDAEKGATSFSSRRRPSQRLRENTRVLERMLGNMLVASFDALLYVGERDEVEPARVFLAWDVYETDQGFSRVSLGNMNLSYRTGDRFLHRMGCVIISEHAMQRVYQRLRTMDQQKVLAELGDAAATLWMHAIREPYEFTPGKTCFATTPHGMAYAEIELDVGLVTITTWIDENKLRPEQQAARTHGIAAKDAAVRYYSNAKHVPGFGQIQKTPSPVTASQDEGTKP